MWGTIIVAGILVVIVAAILFGMRKDRKSGKGITLTRNYSFRAANVRVVIKSFCMYNERTWMIE